MNFVIRIDSEKLMAALQAAPVRLREEMVLAMKIGTRNIAERARKEHRFTSRSGHLEQSITGRVESDNPVVGVLTTGGAIAPYAVYLHGGTGLYGPRHAKYLIVPRDRGDGRQHFLRWATPDGRFVFARKVMHPGIRPDPFLIQAAENELPALEKLFRQAIDRAIR